MPPSVVRLVCPEGHPAVLRAVPARPAPSPAPPACPPAADRVDRLRPEEQLTLKVASVLGLTIYRQLLQVGWVGRQQQ